MTNNDLFDDNNGAAGLAAMAEAIKEIKNSVAELAKKIDDDDKKKPVDDKTYPEPDKEKDKMQAEFEKQISELKEQNKKFEEEKTALKNELGTFHAKEHTEQIAGIVEAQFEKGLITEDKKVQSAEALKDFSKEHLTAFAKQIELMNAEPTKSKAFKAAEPGNAGATDKDKAAAKLETTKKDFSEIGLKPETAELMARMEAGAL